MTPPHVTFNDQSGPPILPHNTATDFLTGSTAWTATEISVSTKGAGTVLLSLTHDGGHHWHQWTVHLPHLLNLGGLSNPILYQVNFLNTQDGWLQFGPDSYTEPDGMELWRTTDGGQHWTRVAQISDSAGVMTGSVTFTSPTLGWMTASHIGPQDQLRHNVVMRTRNGGLTWTSFHLSYPAASAPVFHGRTGLIAAIPDGPFVSNNHVILLRSNDTGIHWSDPAVRSITTNSLRPFELVSTRCIWDLTASDHLLRSTTSGRRWTIQSAATIFRGGNLDFINVRLGWVWDNTRSRSRAWKTTDGGQSWMSWTPVITP